MRSSGAQAKIMADVFDFWRAMWPMGDAWSPAPSEPDETRSQALANEARANLSSAPDLRLELATLWLFERRPLADKPSLPVLIVAPFALHDSAIADFAEGHSLMRRLVCEGWIDLR